MNFKELNSEYKNLTSKLKDAQDRNSERNFIKRYCKFINNLTSDKHHVLEPNTYYGSYTITNDDKSHTVFINLKKYMLLNNDIESVLELFFLRDDYENTSDVFVTARTDTIEGLYEIIHKTLAWLGRRRIDKDKEMKACGIILSDERISKVFGKPASDIVKLRRLISDLLAKIETYIEYEKNGYYTFI